MRGGRRYFIFADLAEGEPDEAAARVATAAGKVLVLATSSDAAHKVGGRLNVNGWSVLGKDDIEKSLDAFTAKDHAILALAGRYDGIDLPDDACRLARLKVYLTGRTFRSDSSARTCGRRSHSKSGLGPE